MEAVIHKETGLLVEPNDPVGLARAIKFMLSNSGRVEEMGQLARQRAWHQFRWDKRINLVRGMLEKIVNNGLS